MTQSFSPAWYQDPLMNSLLHTKLSKVEEECNLKLFPTYSLLEILCIWSNFI
jgi:hypothetical protein